MRKRCTTSQLQKMTDEQLLEQYRWWAAARRSDIDRKVWSTTSQGTLYRIEDEIKARGILTSR